MENENARMPVTIPRPADWEQAAHRVHWDGLAQATMAVSRGPTVRHGAFKFRTGSERGLLDSNPSRCTDRNVSHLTCITIRNCPSANSMTPAAIMWLIIGTDWTQLTSFVERCVNGWFIIQIFVGQFPLSEVHLICSTFGEYTIPFWVYYLNINKYSTCYTRRFGSWFHSRLQVKGWNYNVRRSSAIVQYNSRVLTFYV
jgi:hypothetical protein